MTSLKFKKLYLMINLPLISIFLILLVIPLFVINITIMVYYVGVLERILLGIWCVFNGLWNALTDYYSFFKNNRFYKVGKSPIWGWWLVFILGIGFIITALLGYGFNGVSKPL